MLLLRIYLNMEEGLLDTNVILRYLVKDDENLFQRAVEIFKKGEAGKIKLVIKPIVVAECVFVLESFYKKTREEISDAFKVFLSQKWLKVEDRKVLLSLWKWYIKKLHFVDSYLLSWAEVNKSKIISFDRQLLKNTQQVGF